MEQSQIAERVAIAIHDRLADRNPIPPMDLAMAGLALLGQHEDVIALINVSAPEQVSHHRIPSSLEVGRTLEEGGEATYVDHVITPVSMGSGYCVNGPDIDGETFGDLDTTLKAIRDRAIMEPSGEDDAKECKNCTKLVPRDREDQSDFCSDECDQDFTTTNGPPDEEMINGVWNGPRNIIESLWWIRSGRPAWMPWLRIKWGVPQNRKHPRGEDNHSPHKTNPGHSLSWWRNITQENT